MEYERLTKRNANGEVETVKRPKSSYIQEVYEEWDEINRELKLRLAELEEKIENGALVELPCKVGDVVYEVFKNHKPPFIQQTRIEKIIITDKGLRLKLERNSVYETSIASLGKTLFLTKAEAEKRLEEIRNETKSIDNSEK